MKPRPVAYALGVFALVTFAMGLWNLFDDLPSVKGVPCGSPVAPNAVCEGFVNVGVARAGAAAFLVVAALAGVGSVVAHRAAKKTAAE